MSKIYIVLGYSLYHSYIDDIFLTSNDSIDKLKEILEDANEYHPNVKLIYEIGKSISFLDLQIKNDNGHIRTSVHHKDAAEPYVVPFQSDHPCHIFENIIRGALFRASRHSSTLNKFNQQPLFIKLMLLYNGYHTYSIVECFYLSFLFSSYPVRYIHYHFPNILKQLSVISTSISTMIYDENEYIQLRNQILNQPTTTEHASASQIASQMDCNDSHASFEPLVKSKLIKRQKQDYSLYPEIIHYNHEQRYAYYKSRLHHIWNETFDRRPITNNRLIVGTRNHKNLQHEVLTNNIESNRTTKIKNVQATRALTNRHHMKRRHF